MKKIFLLGLISIFGLALVGCDVSQTNPQNITTNETTKVFTLSELSQYTGTNGSTAYIAVFGVVYDVTDVFVNGTHQGMQLGGTDATAAFESSPHSMSLLNTLPIVGVLQTNTSLTSTSTTTTQGTTTTITDPTIQTLPVFTLDQLSLYTGANGSTAYIAVYGIIYDVTNAFSNGTHQGMQLGGTDATAVFESSPHSMSLLSTLNVVGSLEGYAPIVVSSTSTQTTTTQNSSTTTDDDDDEHEDEYDDVYDD